jgi:two-component system cell cycle sensor histidine kinase/response regulator CckA
MAEQNKTTAELASQLESLQQQVATLSKELKVTQQTLQESETHFKELVENSTQGILVQRNLKLLFVNQALATMLGYNSLEEVINLSSSVQLIAPYDQDRLLSYHQARTNNKPAPSHYIHDVIKKDGSFITVNNIVREVIWQGRPAIMNTISNTVQEQQHIIDMLNTSEERFRQVVTSISDHIYVTEIKPGQPPINLYISPNIEILTGYTMQQIITDWTFWSAKVIYPDDRERAEKQANLLKAGQSSEVEYRLIRADGTTIWVRDSARVVKQENSHIIYGVVGNITDKKNAEQALRQSERFLQSTLDALTDSIAVLDNTGTVIAVNKTWQSFGQENQLAYPNHAIGSNYLTVCDNATGKWSDEAAIVAQNIRGIINNNNNKDDFSIEYPCHSPTEKRWFVVRTSKFIENNDLRIVITHENITQRKLAREAVRESEQRYRSVIEVLAEGITLQDANGVILACNTSAEQILGLSKDQMMGITSLDSRWRAIHEDGSPFPGETHPAMVTLRTGKPCHNVIMGVYKPDDTLTWISVNSQPVFQPDAEKPYAVVSSFHDITEYRKSQQALQESITRYKTLFNSAPVAIFTKDKEGRYTSSNSKNQKAWLTNPVGHTDAELLPPELAQKFRARDLQVMETGQEIIVEEELPTSQGLAHFITRKTPLRDADGNIIGIMGSSLDITERKNLEDTWQRYAFIANTSKEFMTLINANYVYEAVNDAYCHAHNKSREEIIGKSVRKIWGNDTYKTEIEQQLKKGFAGQEQHFQKWIEFSGMGKRYFDVAYYPYFRDNTVTHIVIVSRDITEKKQSDEELQRRNRELAQLNQALNQSEQHLRSIMDTVIDGIVTINEAGIIESFNKAAEKIFGYSAKETIGQSVNILIPQSHSSRHNSYLTHYKLTGEASVIGKGREAEGKHKNGTIFPIDLAISELDLGHRKTFVAVVRDITEQKQLESQLRQAQKMEAIGRLAGGIAHDFNNLLTIITGHTEFLLSSYLTTTDPRYEGLEHIQNAAEQAILLTRQLLTFSRQQPVETQTLNVNQIIFNFSKMLRRVISEDISFQTSLTPVPVFIKSNPGQIEQALMNLIVNARDAMPKGGTLTITTGLTKITETHPHTDLKPGNYAEISVKDTGTGMDAETQALIFDPFFTTKTASKGTGLGLSTVYGAVKQNEGSIDVKSQLGQGTTVKIYLPAVQENADTPSITAQLTNQVSTSNNKQTNILLVEDEPGVRLITQKILEKQGFNVTVVTHPHEVLQMYQKNESQIEEIDLLITDVVMPDMNGPELVKQLTQYQPKFKVLYVSGYADGSLQPYGLTKGNINLLEKPFSGKALAQAIDKVLNK